MRLTGDILEAIKSRSYQLRPVAQGPARYFLYTTGLYCSDVQTDERARARPGSGPDPGPPPRPRLPRHGGGAAQHDQADPDIVGWQPLAVQ